MKTNLSKKALPLGIALGVLLLASGLPARSDTIAFQGFETSGDTWTFTPGNGSASTTVGATDAPANQRILSGSSSWQVNNASSTNIFDAVSTVGYLDLSVSIRLASLSATSSGNGADAADQVKIYVATNGAAFSATPDITLAGNLNARWGYWATNTATTNVGGVLAVAATAGTTSNNFATLVVNIPNSPTVTSVALKIVANNNDANEVWAYDDVTLFGTLSGPGGPTIGTQPKSRTNNFGTTATFTVSSGGSAPLHYQWRKNGATLTDGGIVSGSGANTLTLTGVSGADAAGYDVIVTNSINAVTSTVATLTVIDPLISASPQGRTVVVGSNTTFNVSAAGTGLSYQWRMEGTNISGANAASYTRTAVTLADQGGYAVVVTGTYGSVTSATATLTVVLPQLPTWDFNNTNDLVTAPAPAVGNGIASLIGGVSSSFVSGSTNDPSSGVSTNGGWSTATYPASSANSKTAGVRFSVDTSGFADISVRWDQRHSGTASRYTRFQYTVDGVNYIDGPIYTNNNTTANATYIARTNDLSGVPAVNNNPNFAFRIVTEFESTAIGSGSANYVPADGGATYGPAGTIRFDFVRVYSASSGSPVFLQIQLLGSDAVLTWTNAGYTLLSAPSVSDVYADVPGATSPYTNPAVGVQKYFRLTNSAAGP